MEVSLVVVEISDEIFFNYVKIRSHKTLRPDSVKSINELITYTFPSLLSALQGFEVSSCLSRELRSALPLPQTTIYSKLLKCWENDLRNKVRLIKPSKKVIEVIDLYISKYVANDLIGVISSGLTETTYLEAPVVESIKKFKTTNEVGDIISLLSRRKLLNEFMSLVLKEYRKLKISELDVDELSRKLRASYFKRLEDILTELDVSPYGLRCVEFLKEFEELKQALRKALMGGEDLRLVTTKLTQKQREVVLKASKNTHDFEYVLAVLPLHFCHNMLKSLPVSVDTLLDYLLLKEFEFSILSYVIYLINTGYSPELIREEVGGWLRLYESIAE